MQIKSIYTQINYNHDNKAIISHIMICNSVWSLVFATKFSSIYLLKEKKTFGFSTNIGKPAACERWYLYVWYKI